MQKQIDIPYCPLELKDFDLFTKKLGQDAKCKIDHNPWNFEFSGEVDVIIAHSDAGILLKFDVIEENVLSRFTKINDPVYKDSCVEFFIALNNESFYYNFEFNCKGTCLAGFGVSAEDRKLLSTEKIRKIQVTSSFKSLTFNQKEMVNWQLTILIPKEVFQFHELDTFRGQQAGVNFYKCGDDLPKPHYLCWSAITSPKPNFHLPAFFGKATFLKT